MSKGAEGSQGERIVWVRMVLWDSEGSEHHKSLSFGAKLSPEKIASSLNQIQLNAKVCQPHVIANFLSSFSYLHCVGTVNLEFEQVYNNSN